MGPGMGPGRGRGRVTAAGVAAVLAAVLLAAACTAPATPDGGRSATPTPTPTPTASTEPVPAAQLRVPDAATTVLGTDDPAALALATSRALYASAPIAVVTAADPAAVRRGACAAVAIGAPLLLAGDAADGELERLDVRAVLTVGEVAVTPPGDAAVVAAPADDAELADVLGVTLGAGDVAAGADLAAVAALDRAAPVLLRSPDDPAPQPAATPEPTPTAGTPTAAPTARPTGTPDLAHLLGEPTEPTGPAEGTPSAALPATVLAATPAGALVLTTGDASQTASVATARAAGVPVVTVTGADPRVESADVQAIAAAAPTSTLALGTAFGTPDTLGWKVATAATGVELPGGGQTVLNHRRMIAMYGTPSFPALGILGEQDLPTSVARAQGLAAQYQPFTTDRVVPAFEIIVTIASSGAGDDGNYSNELPVEMFVPWVEAARDAGIYVVLDLQPGRTDFLTQAQRYAPLLEYPNVGLALDPEWRLAPDQVHLRQIGSVGVDEVNAVAAYLAQLTRDRHLPQKLFVLHQFQLRMVAGRERLDTTHPELATLIHVDGQGSQPAKAGTWAALQQGAPPGVAWGWKNFIDEDVPMLTPDQTYAVQPPPFLVSYQ